jgi:hypothetical protein
METPKPQVGIWTLTAPDGSEFKAESPMYCCRKEQETRAPKEVALERLFASMNKCWLCEEDDYKYTLGKGTPAEIKVCLTCKNTLLSTTLIAD